MNRKDLINDLETLDDGLHEIRDSLNRLYMGIVKDNKVLFYVSGTGTVYQDDGYNFTPYEQKFKEIGNLSSPEDFNIIAKFNKWI